MDKLGNCQKKLKWWSKRCFGNITWEVVEKRKRIRAAEDSVLQGNNVELLVKLKIELAGLLMKEEQMW